MAIYSEFSHSKWWFSIAFCMFTRGYEYHHYPIDRPYENRCQWHPDCHPLSICGKILNKLIWKTSIIRGLTIPYGYLFVWVKLSIKDIYYLLNHSMRIDNRWISATAPLTLRHFPHAGHWFHWIRSMSSSLPKHQLLLMLDGTLIFSRLCPQGIVQFKTTKLPLVMVFASQYFWGEGRPIFTQLVFSFTWE